MTSHEVPLVAVHGLGDGPQVWEPLANCLPRVSAVAVPGLGGGGSGAFSLGAAVQAVEQQAGPRIDLIGHSLGGMVALATAARRPDLVRRMVLVGATARPPRLLLRVQDRLIARIPQERFGAGPSKDQVLAVTGAARHIDLRGAARGIQAPTLLVLGRTDVLNAPAALTLRRVLPRSEFAWLPGGHTLAATSLERLAGLVETFVDESD